MTKLKVAFLIVLGFLVTGCEQKSKSTPPEEGYITGNITILADESLEPIVAEEEYVFESLFPDAKLNIRFLSENALLNSFLNDSIRVAIVSRKLTPAENKILVDRKLPPIVSRFAVDAVALIVNKASADTLITVSEIKKMLGGQTKTGKNIVFDNASSSLVRYLKDFAGNLALNQKNVYALSNNKAVIKYVSENTGAIGIVGFSWLNDPDADYAKYVQGVKIVGVKDEAHKAYPAEYFKPSQNTLVLHQYPLSRDLYIINSTGKLGLGTGFAAFLASERGQRIILKSGLLPDSIPRREINIIKELKKQ